MANEASSAGLLNSGVIPHLNVVGAAAASEFYQRAFGARELLRVPSDDPNRLSHVRLQLNGGTLMLCDCFPERGFEHQPSHSFTMMLIVADIDAWWKRAVEAGAEVVVPIERMFWGDRFGQLRDPFEVLWAMDEPGDMA
ncbi:MAG: VOC family protein [Caulobacteraceae bacterium]|nr:VOC family protein [Caulobacteraceae bacterium]